MQSQYNYLIKRCLNLFYSAIGRGLSVNGWAMWIGLSDIESDGNYVWMNGDQASSTDETLWGPGQPSAHGGCGWSRFTATKPNVVVTDCSSQLPGICEKPV